MYFENASLNAILTGRILYYQHKYVHTRGCCSRLLSILSTKVVKYEFLWLYMFVYFEIPLAKVVHFKNISEIH